MTKAGIVPMAMNVAWFQSIAVRATMASPMGKPAWTTICPMLAHTIRVDVSFSTSSLSRVMLAMIEP